MPSRQCSKRIHGFCSATPTLQYLRHQEFTDIAETIRIVEATDDLPVSRTLYGRLVLRAIQSTSRNVSVAH
jgi:hypothetical protein